VGLYGDEWQLHDQAVFTPREKPRYQSNKRPGGPWGRSGRGGGDKKKSLCKQTRILTNLT